MRAVISVIGKDMVGILAAVSAECAASKMQQERRPEAMQTKQTPHTTPERQPVPLSDAAARA